MPESGKRWRILTLNTLAFSVCFAVWMTNGVLATFLADHGVFDWSPTDIAWLMAIPVLSGSVARLPVGVLTDRFGGRPVYTLLMLLAAGFTFALSYAEGFTSFAWLSLGFGLSGASFAVGIAYTSLWFSRERQGTALGIFGAGNAGAAATSMGAPHLLRWLTDGGENLEAWRMLPRIYAGTLAVMAVAFFLLTENRRVAEDQGKSLAQRLSPLRHLRVWRFSLYYFLVFGMFVALAQWLIPYYVGAYGMSLVTAGTVALAFTLPSGVIRALGGWMSDRWGARTVMYWVLGCSVLCCGLLLVPRMDVHAPGRAVMAKRGGVVERVSAESLAVAGIEYPLEARPADGVGLANDPRALILPRFEFWQEPRVAPGDTVGKRELLARGVTHVYFQANVWVFTGIVCVLGLALGIGKAAVYRHIPDYFPRDVGVVGGIVGVIGGLGGCVGPIVFGYLLEGTGIWTTAWLFLLALSLASLVWMHVVVKRILRERAPHALRQMEHDSLRAPGRAPSAETAPVAGLRLGGEA